MSNAGFIFVWLFCDRVFAHFVFLCLHGYIVYIVYVCCWLYRLWRRSFIFITHAIRITIPSGMRLPPAAVAVALERTELGSVCSAVDICDFNLIRCAMCVYICLSFCLVRFVPFARDDCTIRVHIFVTVNLITNQRALRVPLKRVHMSVSLSSLRWFVRSITCLRLTDSNGYASRRVIGSGLLPCCLSELKFCRLSRIWWPSRALTMPKSNILIRWGGSTPAKSSLAKLSLAQFSLDASWDWFEFDLIWSVWTKLYFYINELLSSVSCRRIKDDVAHTSVAALLCCGLTRSCSQC